MSSTVETNEHLAGNPPRTRRSTVSRLVAGDSANPRTSANAVTILLAMCLTLSGFSNAHADADQACIAGWSARFGTPADDEIQAAVRDDDGNVYLGGYEGGVWGSQNDWPTGDSTGFVEKRSPTGDLLWRFAFDTDGVDIVEALTLDAGGGVAVAGRTSGSFEGFANAGKLDLFVATLSADGALTGLVEAGDERPQHPASIGRLADGSLIVAGHDNTHVVGNAVIDTENGFIARFVQESGNWTLDWWKKSRDRISDIRSGVAAASDGTLDFFVTSSIRRRSAIDGGTNVARFDIDGDEIWRRQISNHSLDFLTDVLVREGVVHAVGTTVGSPAGENLGGSDGMVFALDPRNGETLWSTQVGTGSGDELHGMAYGPLGELYVVGSTWIPGEAQQASVADREEVFAMTIDAYSGVVSSESRHQEPSSYTNPRVVVPRGCGRGMLLTGPLSTDSPPPGGLGRIDAFVRPIEPVTMDSIISDGFEFAGAPPVVRPSHPGRHSHSSRLR